MHKCISYLNRQQQQQQQQHGPHQQQQDVNHIFTTSGRHANWKIYQAALPALLTLISLSFSLSLSVPALAAPLAAAEQCLLTVTSPRAICQVAPFALKVVRHDAAHAFYRSPLDSIARNRNRNRNSHNQSRQLVCSSAEHKRAQYRMPNSQTKYQITKLSIYCYG